MEKDVHRLWIHGIGKSVGLGGSLLHLGIIFKNYTVLVFVSYFFRAHYNLRCYIICSNISLYRSVVIS